jgi:hypothetical protein
VTVAAAGRKRTVRLAPKALAAVRLDLGPPEREGADLVVVELSAAGAVQKIERGLRTALRTPPVAPMPEAWRGGMALRGAKETGDFGLTLAYIRAGSQTCGGVARTGLVAHPPYVGGVGYVFALYEPVALPAGPKAAFRAWVGKGDGGDLGDGILYKVAVVDEAGRETAVAERQVARFEWLPIEADLSPWAGKTVRLKLVADVGPADNSSADWAAWADLRIEALQPLLVRTLDEDPAPYRRGPGT